MKTFEINGTLRKELGKKASKALRREKNIPCEIYGGEENVHLFVSKDSVRNLVYTPDIYLVHLTLDNTLYPVVLKDIQFHPVSDEILHIDFLQVHEDKPIVMNVPVVLQGLAIGVKAGGKLALEMRKIAVKGLHNDIPERLFINVEKLGIGKSIQIAQLSFDKLELMNTKDSVVCSVRATRAAKGDESTAEATEASAN